MSSLTSAPQQLRVTGLDSIRALCALVVTVGHVGFLSPEYSLYLKSKLPWIGSALGITINAPAAVIVFFVLSGFCIHFPFRNGTPINLCEYLVRRMVRIWLPLFMILLFRRHLYADLPVWSLYAEIAYYLLYPLLLTVANRYGWKSLIFISFIIALGVAFSDPMWKNYPSFGVWNCLLGLPCWLLGCELANRYDQLKVNISRGNLWNWRIAVWSGTVFTLVLRFHSPIGYPFTLNFFALLVFFWLSRELVYWRQHTAPAFLEWLGKWSYSLYLVHMMAMLVPGFLGWDKDWMLLKQYACVFSLSYLFYLAFEKPGVALSKYLGALAKKVPLVIRTKNRTPEFVDSRQAA